MGPNVACLLAFCRTAGFARGEFHGVWEDRAHLTCYRKWPEIERTAPAPELVSIENSWSRDHNFSATHDDYMTVWFTCGETALDCDNTQVQVGPFGSRPVSVQHSGGNKWQVNCKLPPGLARGWHDVTISVRGSCAWSAPSRIPVDLSKPERRASSSKVSAPQANLVRPSRAVKSTQAKPAKSPGFSGEKRVVLAGSEKEAAPNSVHVKATPPKSKVTVSVIVKRKEPLKINQRGGRANGPARVSPAWFKKHHSADPSAIKQIKAFAKEFNLTVEPDPTASVRRTVQLTGTAADIQKAFGVVLEQKTVDGVERRVREGGIHLPASLKGVVEAVLGLDNRPQAQPHFRVHKSGAAAPSSYTPPQVATAYKFPQTPAEPGRPSGSSNSAAGTGKPTSPPTSKRSVSPRRP